jgi:hypothetical protein
MSARYCHLRAGAFAATSSLLTGGTQECDDDTIARGPFPREPTGGAMGGLLEISRQCRVVGKSRIEC